MMMHLRYTYSSLAPRSNSTTTTLQQLQLNLLIFQENYRSCSKAIETYHNLAIEEVSEIPCATASAGKSAGTR